MTSGPLLPIEQAQPDTAGFADTGSSQLSRRCIKIILNADRQNCYSNWDAALLSAGTRGGSGRACLHARRRWAQQICLFPRPICSPWQGFLQTMSAGYVRLGMAIRSVCPSDSKGGDVAIVSQTPHCCLSLPIPVATSALRQCCGFVPFAKL